MEISLTVSPIKDAKGTIVGASKIVRDITGQKQAKRELERAHSQAVAASRAKDDFLAALSHELRTPLNPVLLLASEAAEDPQNCQRQFARSLPRSAIMWNSKRGSSMTFWTLRASRMGSFG